MNSRSVENANSVKAIIISPSEPDMYLLKGSKHAINQEYHLCSPSAQASDCLLEKLIQMRELGSENLDN